MEEKNRKYFLGGSVPVVEDLDRDIIRLVIPEGKGGVENPYCYWVFEGGSAADGNLRSGNKAHVTDSSAKFSPCADSGNGSGLIFCHFSQSDSRSFYGHDDYCSLLSQEETEQSVQLQLQEIVLFGSTADLNCL